MTDRSPDTPATARTLPFRVADLPTRRAQPFHLRPDAAARAEIARDLGLTGLRKLDFRGTITAEGRRDWRLEGRLGATVVQPCVITADPVTTRIDTDVLRRFLKRMPEPEGAEVEMPEDDTIEPLGTAIDPGAVMIEALAIALPDYPRAPDAELGQADFPPPGAASDAPERPNPFAVLAKLKPSDPSNGGPTDPDTDGTCGGNG
ncbi:MAG: putative metal-binding protein [Rhodobacteraceae bacterium HLUCCA12]|nr:MAG: putative metal-binding protein [Rhodobacteraceae bacterium HLUCCA12]